MAHLTDLDWARVLGQDLGFWQRLRVQRHLRGCQRCAAQASALEAERQAFAAAPRFGSAIDRLVATAPTARAAPATAARRWAPLLAIGSLGAVAAAAFVLVSRPGDLQAKGGDLFVLTVHRGERNLPFGDQCRVGDAVRATYSTSAAPTYLLVLGTDSTGQVQQLFPAAGEASAAISSAGTTPGSWVLDATPGRQCFSALFSSAPLQRQTAELYFKGGAVPSGVQVVTRCCEKAAP